jgi:ribosomal-protein-alanine N-acetyltransferase
VIDAGPCRLRSWRTGDLEDLVRHANDREVWLNLRDAFPYPYTEADGIVWLAAAEINPFNFAIEVGGKAAGSIGFTPGDDVHRVSAEIGYWLGRPFWGRGIGTAAVSAACTWAFEHYDWHRLFAGVFAPNVASMRVLEKAGFQREGVLRNAVVKDGRVLDQIQYALVR